MIESVIFVADNGNNLVIRLKELQKIAILERQAFNEIPPGVTFKGQELVESIMGLLRIK